MSVALEVLSGIFKGVELSASVIHVVSNLKKDGDLSTGEKVDVVIEIAFCFLQTVDLAYTGTRLIAPRQVEHLSKKLNTTPEKLGVGLSIASGVGSVSKTISHKCVKGINSWEDIAEIAGVVFFRVGDVAGQVGNIETLSEKDKEIIEWVSTSANLGGTVLSGAHVAVRVYRKCEATKYTSLLLSCASTNSQTTSTPAITVLEEATARNADELEERSRRLTLQIQNWPTLTIIPAPFHNDSVFTKYKCNISSLPIRHAVRARTTLCDVLYEKATLHEWKVSHPNQKPPGWPENLPFSGSYIIADEKVQHEITARLEFYSKTCSARLNAMT